VAARPDGHSGDLGRTLRRRCYPAVAEGLSLGKRLAGEPRKNGDCARFDLRRPAGVPIDRHAWGSSNCCPGSNELFFIVGHNRQLRSIDAHRLGGCTGYAHVPAAGFRDPEATRPGALSSAGCRSPRRGNPRFRWRPRPCCAQPACSGPSRFHTRGLPSSGVGQGKRPTGPCSKAGSEPGKGRSRAGGFAGFAQSFQGGVRAGSPGRPAGMDRDIRLHPRRLDCRSHQRSDLVFVGPGRRPL
jgi:hypothetical protein